LQNHEILSLIGSSAHRHILKSANRHISQSANFPPLIGTL
jgi:hypothetical protein